MMRALEDRRVYESTLLQHTVEVAIYNTNRPKHKGLLNLWKKAAQRADPEERAMAMEKAESIAAKYGRAAAALIAERSRK